MKINKVSIFSFVLGMVFLFSESNHSILLMESEREVNSWEENTGVDDLREKDGKSIEYNYSNLNDNALGVDAVRRFFFAYYNLVESHHFYLEHITANTAFYLLYCCLRIPLN